MSTTEQTQVSNKKQRLLGAAVRVILRHGYVGATVEQICTEAAVTKGSFFHYFANKEEIAMAAMDAWMAAWLGIVAAGRLHEISDPLARLNGLFDVMTRAYTDPGIHGCVIGTIAQEMAVTNEAMRRRCLTHFKTWTDNVARLLADAKAVYRPRVEFEPEEVAWWLQSFVQGSIIIAKTRQSRDVIVSNIHHCRAYVNSLFERPSGEA